MTIKSMRDALNEALHHEFERDPRVFLIGEDVGGFEKDGQPVEIGGVFGVSKGLYRKYGRKRVIDTPISEAAIIGAASGAALCGMRPIAEIMFADLTAVCFDQIVNQIAKFRYMFGGQCACPVVIRMKVRVDVFGPEQSDRFTKDIERGVENFPAVMNMLMTGAHHGKLLLKV